MGSQIARDFAGQVADGNVELEGALSWHLSSNHYPPLPAFFIPTCIRAIEAGQDEEWDLEIPLPLGCVIHQQPLTEVDGVQVHHPDGAVLDAKCVVEPVVTWKDGRAVVRVGDFIESFHLDSFL